MAEGFKYGVFWSYSSSDRETARAIAQRLREDGPKVWFACAYCLLPAASSAVVGGQWSVGACILLAADCQQPPAH